MREVLSNLWISSLEDILDLESLRKSNIKYVLTVMDTPLESHYDEFKYKFIKAYDVPNQDLISYFDESCEFIQKGIEEGGVVVHCMAGVSRSGTIVTSYVMKTLNLNPIEAIDKIREKSYIAPNTGFIQQLKMYYNMKFKLDNTHRDYKQFLFGSTFTSNEIVQTPITKIESPVDEVVEYKCKKCRTLLFNNSDVVYHSKVVGESEVNNETRCTDEVFVESVSWIDTGNLQEGKINCPKCATKLGSFTWVGEKCVCKNWVVPAFHFAKQKVDINGKRKSN